MSTDLLSTVSTDSKATAAPLSLICPKCNVEYPNIDELLKHQAASKHFVCSQCDAAFHTPAGLQGHKAKSHRPVLDLECFGCHSHFTEAARFWRHLESNECKVIFPSDIARLREKNLEFAKQLELRNRKMDDVFQEGAGHSHIKFEDTWASEVQAETTPVKPVVAQNFPSRPAPVLPGNAHPVHYRSENFPTLPNNPEVPTATDLRNKQKGNIWSNRKLTHNSVKVSYNSVPPPVSYDVLPKNSRKTAIDRTEYKGKIQIVQAPANPSEGGPHRTTSSGRVVDPNDRNYNPAVFYNEILEKFVCPYKSCLKGFHNAVGLTRHLGSPAHTDGRLSCIRCMKTCTTVAGLISHMETTTNCPIRGTDGFRRALGQLTGGILDFNIRSGMFVIDQESVKKLYELRSKSTM
ncbi:hypothetical protein F4802DRAFT_53381 [Xylaria palmicola]|nr:hypothetical protein F4802DRAFT_53381 [Xylaria palmicola]